MAAVTLCFLLQGSPQSGQVLLGLKKTGFGAGKIVGLGGHVEPGENDAQAACREVFEESGVVVAEQDLVDAGLVIFDFPAKPEWNMSTRIYVARRWSGEPVETSEIRPEWFDVNALPLAHMWQDAEHWLPLALQGSVLHLEVVLHDDNETVREVRDHSRP